MLHIFIIRTGHIADINACVFCQVLFADLRRHGGCEGREGARNRSADCKRATWQRRSLGRAQCRFKMASVRDRYRGICVKNDRICDIFGSGWAQELPWNYGGWTPHKAPAHGPLNIIMYVSQPYCADTILHIGTYIDRTASERDDLDICNTCILASIDIPIASCHFRVVINENVDAITK